MFIRIIRPQENKELLLNVDQISKIEVQYGVPWSDGNYRIVSLEEGAKNINAIRFYIVHIAGDILRLESTPGDPVIMVIEEIYKAAIKS